jgi:hypothetical protein
VNASGPRRLVVKLPGKRRRGSARFVLFSLPFEGARGRIGWGRLRLALLRELLRPQAVVSEEGLALDWGIEHFKRAAAGVDLVIMRQGIKTGPASTASVVRSRRPDHVTQSESTNTAGLPTRSPRPTARGRIARPSAGLGSHLARCGRGAEGFPPTGGLGSHRPRGGTGTDSNSGIVP